MFAKNIINMTTIIILFLFGYILGLITEKKGRYIYDHYIKYILLTMIIGVAIIELINHLNK